MHNLQPESHLSRAMFDSSSQRLFCFIHHMLIKITSLAQMELTNHNKVKGLLHKMANHQNNKSKKKY